MVKNKDKTKNTSSQVQLHSSIPNSSTCPQAMQGDGEWGL